jgi:hypothetical protein
MQGFEKMRTDKRSSKEDLDAYFDTLEPVDIDCLSGFWRGGILPTGQCLDFLLTGLPIIHWHGKDFRSINEVKAVIYYFFGLEFNLPWMTARLRPALYRGKNSATMAYDYLPVIDYFRKIDRKTIMGIMEWRKQPTVYFFLEKNE